MAVAEEKVPETHSENPFESDHFEALVQAGEGDNDDGITKPVSTGSSSKRKFIPRKKLKRKSSDSALLGPAAKFLKAYTSEKHPVSVVFEMGVPSDAFTELPAEGVGHARTFKVNLVVDGMVYEGQGTNKKQARENAARQVVDKMLAVSAGPNEHQVPPVAVDEPSGLSAERGLIDALSQPNSGSLVENAPRQVVDKMSAVSAGSNEPQFPVVDGDEHSGSCKNGLNENVSSIPSTGILIEIPETVHVKQESLPLAAPTDSEGAHVEGH